MTTKIKLSLSAIAFVLAIGGAFASKANNSALSPCTTTTPKSSGECPGLNNVQCCLQGTNVIFKQS